MTGTLINFAAIVIGSLIGLLAGNRIPEKTKQTLISVLGMFTLAYGIFIFQQTQNTLIPLFALVLGTIIGELLSVKAPMPSTWHSLWSSPKSACISFR